MDTTVRRLGPGLTLSLAVSAAALLLRPTLPLISPLLTTVVVGLLLNNTMGLPEVFRPGLAFASRGPLRVGIVLLGLQVAVGDTLSLGWGTILGVGAVVALTVTGSLVVGNLLGVSRELSTLIACGFAICGAAAVGSAQEVAQADEEEVATAITLVIIFGTAMIFIGPAVVGLTGLSARDGGVWIGASLHEVAQVVTAGSMVGAEALHAAVVVKLTRVALLAPTILLLSVYRRNGEASPGGQQRRPIIHWFVMGFLLMVALENWLSLPHALLNGAKTVQTLCFAAAMFGMGTGVSVKRLRAVGRRPVYLAGFTTVWIAVLAFLIVR